MTTGVLDGKTVWATGAGKGLGRAVASRLVRDGATVIATSRSRDDLESLAAEHPAGRVIPAPGSVANETDVERIIASLPEPGTPGGSRLHGLVNCAGISPSFVRSESLDLDTFEKVLQTNTIGSFLCARGAGRLMLAQRAGSIVNISSIHARVGFARLAAYAASKGAVDSLTATLAVEWADRGVRVNTVAPGYYRTELSEGLLDSKWGAEIVRRIPMGRTGEPDELGAAVSFLLSDASSYMTGATMSIDGGWLAW